jgi:hypothetical protein
MAAIDKYITFIFLPSTHMQFRHGDVFLEKTSEKISKKLQKSKTNKVALGEATGHAHKLGDTATLFVEPKTKNWGRMLAVPVETPLSHEEHKTIPLPPGTYKVTHQRTFSKTAFRKVLD